MLIYDIVLSINFSFFPLGYYSNLSIFQKHNLAKISLFGRPNIYEYGDFAVCQDPIQSIEGAMLAKVESGFVEVLSIINKLTSLGATLVRNYDPLTHSLTDRGKV